MCIERGEGSGNSNQLPGVEWEAFDRRVSIPADLQRLMDAPFPIVRVPQKVHQKIIARHSAALEAYAKLSLQLETWEKYNVGNRRWEIYMPVRVDGDRLLAIIGLDKTGSFNLVSLYWVRRRNWRNRNLIARSDLIPG